MSKPDVGNSPTKFLFTEVERSALVANARSITAQIEEFEAEMRGLANGIPVDHEVDINPQAPAEQFNLLTLAQIMVHEREVVSFERRSGSWGLFYTRTPSPGRVMADGSRSHTTPLRDAPLTVKAIFLQNASDFLRAYTEKAIAFRAMVEPALAGGQLAINQAREMRARLGIPAHTSAPTPTRTPDSFVRGRKR